MRTFQKQAAQGDVLLRRIATLPAGVQLVPSNKWFFIVAHSETGHNHVIDSRNAQLFIDETNQFIGYLNVLSPAELVHLRDHDTHETLAFAPGVYRVRRQREATPEGWQRAQD